MLKLFQTIRPVSSLFVLIAGLLVRLPLLIYGTTDKNAVSLNVMQDFFALANQNIYISVIGGLMIVFIQSLIFNKLCIDHDVIYTHSYMPAYFFMLLNSVFIENLFINPIMLINFFILFSLISMYRMYRMENTSVTLFYTAMFYGCASLVMPVIYSGLLFLIIGTIIFKNITLKDLLALISGYTLPLLMLWSILFLAGYNYVIPRFSYRLEFGFGSNLRAYTAIVYILILTGAGLFKTTLNYTKNNIKTRRISLFMVGNLVFFTLLLLLKMNEYQFYFPLLTFAISLQVAYFLIGKKAGRWKEFLHYMLLATILFSLYGNIWLGIK